MVDINRGTRDAAQKAAQAKQGGKYEHVVNKQAARLHLAVNERQGCRSRLSSESVAREPAIALKLTQPAAGRIVVNAESTGCTAPATGR